MFHRSTRWKFSQGSQQVQDPKPQGPQEPFTQTPVRRPRTFMEEQYEIIIALERARSNPSQQ